MADQTPEQKRYHSDVRETAKKVPADKSEQKVTRSTEGSVERTTERSGDRNR